MAVTQRTIGGQQYWAGESRKVNVRGQSIIVDLTPEKARRFQAAVMKNEIQADIRAIDVPASAASMERRESMKESRAVGKWAAEFAADLDKARTGKKQGKKIRKKRARKHIGRGMWGNDTGLLADGLRVHRFDRTPLLQVTQYFSDPARLQNNWGGADASLRYAKFRNDLNAYADVLGKPELMLMRQKVKQAIEKIQRSMIAIKGNV